MAARNHRTNMAHRTVVMAALLLLLVNGAQASTANILQVKHFGKIHGCAERVNQFLESTGEPTSVDSLTKNAQVCLPDGPSLYPALQNGNVLFLDGAGARSHYTLHTGGDDESSVQAFYSERDNQWLVNVGASFQMVIRDCALTALYNTNELSAGGDEVFGLAPHSTFIPSEPHFPCCGESCSRKSCETEEGYSSGLLSTFYPKPSYGCQNSSQEDAELPPTRYFDDKSNIDQQISPRCQKNLNICTVGEGWPGAPLPRQYSTGCFATRMIGEVFLPPTPAKDCDAEEGKRHYKICIEHDDFLKIEIGDSLFEYTSEHSATQNFTPFTVCRRLSLEGKLEEGSWVPIHVHYSGTGVNRFSHLRVSVLPLRECVKEEDKTSKVFCKPCEGELDADCCNPLGECALRYKGECSPEQNKVPVTGARDEQTAVDPKDERVYEIESGDFTIKHSRALQDYRTPVLAKPSCRVGGQVACASAIVGKGFLYGSIFDHEYKATIPMCCISKPAGKRWYQHKKAPVYWSISVVEYEPAVGPWISILKGNGVIYFDRYGNPQCGESLHVAYNSRGLHVGEYSAKLRVISGDEHTLQTEDVLLVHLIVTPPMNIEYKHFQIDRKLLTAEFKAHVYSPNKNVRIHQDNLQLTTGGAYDTEYGEISQVYADRDSLALQGRMRIKDPFVCQNNPFQVTGWGTVKYHYQDCGKVGLHQKSELCYPPTCRFYAVDSTFRGGEGIVTDKYSGEFILVCTQAPKICKDCIVVKGPYDWKIEHFSRLKESKTSFYIKVSWGYDYYGPITIGAKHYAHSRKGCSLELEETFVCGHNKFHKVKDIEPVTINRIDHVSVSSIGYQVLQYCSGNHCKAHSKAGLFPHKILKAQSNHAQDYYDKHIYEHSEEFKNIDPWSYEPSYESYKNTKEHDHIESHLYDTSHGVMDPYAAKQHSSKPLYSPVSDAGHI